MCLVFAALAFGQSTGGVQGRVTDASGAVIANALVTVKDEAHGVERNQATDSPGTYFVPALPAGSYTVGVKAPGLSSTEAKGIFVELGTTTTQNFALTVASSAQVVEVMASAPLVDTSTASAGSVMD